MAVAQSAKPSSSDITVTLKRLIALLEEDETDEYGILQPKPFAFKLAMRLVERDVTASILVQWLERSPLFPHSLRECNTGDVVL